MASDERGRSPKNTDRIVQAEELGDADPGQVLQHHEDNCRGDENQEGASTGNQRSEIGVQANGSEKIDQENVPGFEVERDLCSSRGEDHPGQQTDQETATDRFRNIVFPEDRDFLVQELSEEKDENGNVEGGMIG